MSIMAHAGLFLKRAAAGPTLVGISFRAFSAGVLAYPAGTQAGDLLVLVQHGGGVPSGWTLRANTGGGSQNGYTSQSSMKIAGSETSVVTAGNTNYDAYLFAIRGATSLDTTFQYSDITGGGSRSYTVATTAKNVIACGFDRGATGGGFPTASATGRVGQLTGDSTYFKDIGAFYPSMPVGGVVSITDFNDTYSTDCLFLTVV